MTSSAKHATMASRLRGLIANASPWAFGKVSCYGAQTSSQKSVRVSRNTGEEGLHQCSLMAFLE
jgi:hypothetical protein